MSFTARENVWSTFASELMPSMLLISVEDRFMRSFSQWTYARIGFFR